MKNFVLTALLLATTLASAQANYQGVWWGGQREAGWNLNLAHQDNVIFALWATYDEAGKATWFSMTATQSTGGPFTGTLYRTTIPPSSNPSAYDPSRLSIAEAGTATIAFSSADEGTFTYRIGGVERSRGIVRFEMDAATLKCAWRPASQFNGPRNATDIWWSAAQPGSAVATLHIEPALYFTWFTYAADGSPTWFHGVGFDTYGDYDAPLFTMTGPSYMAPAFDPASVTYTRAGGVELQTDGFVGLNFDAGRAPFPQYRETLTRYVFRGGGTTCGQ